MDPLKPRQIAVRFARGQEKAEIDAALSALDLARSGATARPAFSDPSRLDAMSRQARKRSKGSEPPPDYGRYYVIDTPPGMDARALGALVGALRQTAGVERAWLRGIPTLPSVVDGSPNPNSAQQGYLSAAPEGLGIRCAWRMPGGDGTGLRLVDIERGWDTTHPEIARYFGAGVSILGTGEIDDDAAQHGTNVLGIVAAKDDAAFGVGIAPAALDVRACSWSRGGEYNVDIALEGALTWLTLNGAPGDVVLIQTQAEVDAVGGGKMIVPVEWDGLYRELIVDLVGSGFVVVEAAGNGTLDLGPYTNTHGGLVNSEVRDDDKTLVGYWTDPDALDSGAILVGGSVDHMGPSSVYTRSGNSNYGARVDCFAWGTGVWAIHDPLWGGTSAAAAIIAGAAMCLQAIRAATSTGRYPPETVRAYLSSDDPSIGNTPCDPAAQIGVMPNLPGIIVAKLGLDLPDVYLRDHVGDVGGPHTGPAGNCPDIIVLAAGSVDDPSLLDPDAFHGGALVAGVDHEVRLRLRNRGDGDAVQVEARVYWAEPSTLVLPSSWTLIGTATEPLVPPGATRMTPAIGWAHGDLPPAGHYCYVAVLHDDCDPAPATPSFGSFAEFIDWVRAHDNVAWRNFNVVETTAPQSLAWSFTARGGFAEDEWLDLFVDVDLPPGAGFRLEIGEGVPAAAKAAANELRERLARTKFPSAARVPLRGIPLPPNAVLPLVAHVELDQPLRRRHRVRIAQTWKGHALGTITWQLRP
jgi:serine protease